MQISKGENVHHIIPFLTVRAGLFFIFLIQATLEDPSKACVLWCRRQPSLREIDGKSHTFRFDWGPAGKPDVVGVRPQAQTPSNTKSMAFSKWSALALRNRYVLMCTYFAFGGFHFVLCLSFERKRTRKIKI